MSSRTDKLVESVQGLAVSIAVKSHKVQNGAFDLEDMIQSALLGAVAAAHDYQETHDSKASFATFAIHRMRQEVIKLYRKSGVIHIPKKEYEHMSRCERVTRMFNFTYLSTPVVSDDGNQQTAERFLAAPREPDELFISAVQKMIEYFLSRLSPPERDMLQKVYGLTGDEPMTISAAASSRGVSRQRGHQILDSALQHIERMCKHTGVHAGWLDS